MGLTVKKSGSPALGIDIGTSLIKLVEARPGKDGIQITALGIAPTPPGCIDNEIIIDPKTLGQAIRSLITESGISCKKSVSSVSGQSSVIVRIIEVPKMTKQELAETMKWEIERHVPFAANEVVMDFQPVERPDGDPADQNMDVLLAVAQEAVINSHVETLQAAGIEPTAIDVEPLAAARALIDAVGDGAQEGTVVIIDIGASSSELAVYRNGIIAFPRTLPMAGNTITQALSNHLSISIEQAERLKREHAVVLLDRLDLINAAPDMDDMQSGGFGQDDSTMGFSAPQTDQPAEQEYPFMPGLGYGPGLNPTPEEEKPAPVVDTMPDFDIDIGGASAAAPKPVMDFDLPESGDLAIGSTPKLDLSEPGDMMSAGSQGIVDVTGAEGGMMAAVEYSDEAVFQAIAPVLGDLLAEIRRSLDYYISRFQSQPDRILICGGTARIKDLDQLIQMELGIPCSIANPMQNFSVLSKSLSQDYLEDVASIFPVSIGLAIRDMMGE